MTASLRSGHQLPRRGQQAVATGGARRAASRNPWTHPIDTPVRARIHSVPHANRDGAAIHTTLWHANTPQSLVFVPSVPPW